MRTTNLIYVFKGSDYKMNVVPYHFVSVPQLPVPLGRFMTRKLASAKPVAPARTKTKKDRPVAYFKMDKERENSCRLNFNLMWR